MLKGLDFGWIAIKFEIKNHNDLQYVEISICPILNLVGAANCETNSP